MNKRLWGLVAVFAGIAAMLGVWLMMSDDPRVAPENPPPGEVGEVASTDLTKARVGKARMVPMDPSRLKLNVHQAAERRQRLVNLQRSLPTKAAPGVFALDQESIAAAVQERREDLQACYETALLHTPGLSGKMTLALQIEPVPGETWGQVASVGTDGKTDASVLEGCIKTVFDELKFDAREPVTIRYPVSFTSDEAPSPPRDP